MTPTTPARNIELKAEQTILASTGFRCLGHAIWLLFSSGTAIKVFDEKVKQWVQVSSIERTPGAPKGFRITGTPLLEAIPLAA